MNNTRYICGNNWLYYVEKDIVLVFKNRKLLKTMTLEELKSMIDSKRVKLVK